jgi:hypothetical protein
MRKRWLQCYTKKQNMKHFFPLLILIVLAFSCEKLKDSDDNNDQDYIRFSITGRMDQEETNFSSRFNTVRDSFYSVSYAISYGFKCIEFIRYSADFQSYIEMNLTFDSLELFVPDSYFNGLHYDITFNSSGNENRIKLSTIILITFDTVYITPFHYSNIEFDVENNSVSGNFNYSVDSTESNKAQYRIDGDFKINLSK